MYTNKLITNENYLFSPVSLSVTVRLRLGISSRYLAASVPLRPNLVAPRS